MSPKLNTEHFERVVRARICAGCPFKSRESASSGPDVRRACEVTCPLFVHLPLLCRTAQQLDPMVGHRRDVLKGMVERIGEKSAHGAQVVERCGRNVIDSLMELLNA